MILNANAAIAFGHFISSISPTASVASTIASPAMGILLVFSGQFINNNSIPKYFLWIKYFSFLGYSSQAVIVSQWQNVTGIDCEEYSRCFATGKDVIESLNIDAVSVILYIIKHFYFFSTKFLFYIFMM